MSKVLTGLDVVDAGLDGQPLADPVGAPATRGSLIANAIARGQALGREVEAVDLALRLFRAAGDIELDDADFELAKEMVVKDQLLNNIGKASALKAFVE